MPSLPERIEAAEGPSRELDAEIAKAVGAKHGPDSGFSNSENGDYWVVDESALPYSSSIDAAMTIVDGGTRMFDLCKSAMGLDMGGKNWKAVVGHHRNRSAARTPALALCAAALRAKEQPNEG